MSTGAFMHSAARILQPPRRSRADRGLIPGAFSALKDVIISGTGSTDTDKWIGVLQSSFVGALLSSRRRGPLDV